MEDSLPRQIVLVNSRWWGRTYGHRSVIIKIGSKGGWFAQKVGGSSAQYLSCKVFRDWSIIQLWEINNMYEMGRSLLHILNQHLIAFVDLVNLCGL